MMNDSKHWTTVNILQTQLQEFCPVLKNVDKLVFNIKD